MLLALNAEASHCIATDETVGIEALHQSSLAYIDSESKNNNIIFVKLTFPQTTALRGIKSNLITTMIISMTLLVVHIHCRGIY